jgi:hypothetical protein
MIIVKKKGVINMTVKYIAFDGKEFDNEEKCKEYERYVGEDIRLKIGNARNALRRLDEFCEFWSNNPLYNCSKCPLNNLCEDTSFESYFYKGNPFGNVDVDGSLIEED